MRHTDCAALKAKLSLIWLSPKSVPDCPTCLRSGPEEKPVDRESVPTCLRGGSVEKPVNLFDVARGSNLQKKKVSKVRILHK